MLRRGIALSVVALLTATLYAFFFGIAIVGDAGFTADEALHVATAIGFSAVLVTGLLAQIVRPTAAAGFWMATSGIVGMLISVAIVGDPDNYGGQAGPFDYAYLILVVPLLILLALHPARRSLFCIGRPSWLLVGIVILGAVPLALYGVDQAIIQRNSWPPASDPHHNAHWHTMAWTSFAIPLLGLVAAMRFQGWRLAAWAAGGLAVLIGLISLVISDAVSGLDLMWAAAAVVGGIVFLVAALVSPGRPRVATARR